jgi:hypothetical protein
MHLGVPSPAMMRAAVGAGAAPIVVTAVKPKGQHAAAAVSSTRDNTPRRESAVAGDVHAARVVRWADAQSTNTRVREIAQRSHGVLC